VYVPKLHKYGETICPVTPEINFLLICVFPDAVSFSSRRRPALSQGTKRPSPNKGGLTALVADIHGGEGSSVAKSAQELSDEWQADLRAGLKEISTSRAYVTELIQGEKH
jgi:hypothetical protein